MSRLRRLPPPTTVRKGITRAPPARVEILLIARAAACPAQQFERDQRALDDLRLRLVLVVHGQRVLA
jgi:hypothetical protein